jgi:hypothetical protein
VVRIRWSCRTTGGRVRVIPRLRGGVPLVQGGKVCRGGF